MTDIEDSSKSSDNLTWRIGGEGLPLESYCTESFRCPSDFFLEGHRRGALHKVVAAIVNRKKDAPAVSEDISTGKLRLSQDVNSLKETRKSARRKETPSRTTEAAREFFEFFMAKKRRKQKPCVDVAAPDTTTAVVQPVEIFTEQQVAPVQSEAQVVPPYPANLDPSQVPQQIPMGTTAMPHLIPFGDGTQQALVFFVNGTPAMCTSQESNPAINGLSTGNAVIHVNIPVMSSEAVPKDGALDTGGGVIEKAMQLANVTSTMSEASTVQSFSACSTASPLLIGPVTHTLPHISENVEVGPSASIDTLPVDDLVQSVTIQTTQLPQAAPAGLFPAVSAEVKGAAGASRRNACNGSHNKKGVRYRETPTQTGDKESVLSIADNMAEEAAQTSLPTSAQQKDKDRSKKQATEKVRRHNCEVCNKMFYTNHDLKRHKLIHQDLKPFMCEICKKSFRTQSELKLHTPIHNEDTPYKCEYCGKEFRTKGCIKSHIKYHIGDKRHKCKECDRAFVKSADLKRHMAGHRNEKSFKCAQCDSAFTRRDNLKAHMLLHSRSGVVTCDLCNKEFISTVYLKRHMHIHKQAKKKPYECQWCPKTYEQLEGLRRHIRQHVGDEKFVCKHCAKKFITSIQLKRHLWLSHDKESPYRRSVL